MRRFIALLPLLAVTSGQYCTPAVKKFCDAKSFPATACLNAMCPAATKTSVGDADFKQKMVDAHNKYRSLDFQGKTAANMLEVSWSDELAATALQWALKLCSDNKKLTGGHDKCRVSPNFNSVGQNLAWGAGSAWGGSIDPDAMAVKGWNDEKANANTSNMFPFAPSGPVIGHYTQVVWAESYKVGCAYVVQPMPTYGFQGWIACNYAKAGNMLGANVFTTGTRGSKCPAGSSNVNNMCKVNDENALRAALNLGTVA